MSRKLAAILVALLATGAIAAGAVALASGDSDVNVTGTQADRAVKAALDATGGGTANSVELDSEGGGGAKWEVEVTKTDGTTVDVRLDDDYKVVAIEEDSEAPDNDDNGEDE